MLHPLVLTVCVINSKYMNVFSPHIFDRHIHNSFPSAPLSDYIRYHSFSGEATVRNISFFLGDQRLSARNEAGLCIRKEGALLDNGDTECYTRTGPVASYVDPSLHPHI